MAKVRVVMVLISLSSLDVEICLGDTSLRSQSDARV
jgi:hypothetical protein